MPTRIETTVIQPAPLEEISGESKSGSLFKRLSASPDQITTEVKEMGPIITSSWETFGRKAESDPEVAKRFQNQCSAFQSMRGALNAAQLVLIEARAGADSETSNIPRLDWGSLFFGAKILIDKTVRVGYGVGRNCKFPTEYYTYLDTIQFVDALTLSLRFGAISFNDFLSGQNLTPENIVDFFMIPWVISQEKPEGFDPTMELEKVIQANKSPLVDKYPGQARNETLYTIITIDSLVTCGEVEYDQSQPYSENQAKAMKEVRDLGIKLYKSREHLREILTKPEHKEYSTLMKAFAKYEHDPLALEYLLKVANCFEDETLLETYRKSRELIQKDINPKLYTAICEGIVRHIMSSDSSNLPIPMDGLETVLDLEELPSQELPPDVWEQLHKSASEIDRLSRNLRRKSTVHDIVPDPVWNASPLTQPTTIQVEFSPSNPCCQFTLRLAWDNPDKKEGLEIKISYKTNREKIDWSILSSPDDPECQKIKAMFVSIVIKLLKHIRGELTTKLTQSVTSAPEPIAREPVAKKEAPVRYYDEVYRMRKTARKAGTQTLPTFAEMVSKEMPTYHEPDIRVIPIVIPEGSKLDDLLSDIPVEDRERVVRAMGWHNSGNPSNIGKLTYTYPDCVHYVLRMKGYRVILLRVKDENGEHFVPEKAKDRKDAYR